MIIVGLTGSIGMGKSTAARQLRRMGIPVHEADAAVHRLLGPGGQAVPFVASLFPGTLRHGIIDRRRLGEIVYADRRRLKKLEAVLHPLVHAATARWLQRQYRLGRELVVLDIPLLLETGRKHTVDRIWVVSAPAAIQRARVLLRPGMTPARLTKILSHQLGDAAKRRRADAVIPTGDGPGVSRAHLARALTQARRRPGRAFQTYWKKTYGS